MALCKKKHKNISARQMKNFDQTEFVKDLLGVDWRGIVRNTDDTNVFVNTWTNLLSLNLENMPQHVTDVFLTNSALG